MFEMYGSVFNTVYGIVLAFICAFFISVTSTPVVRHACVQMRRDGYPEG